MAKRCICTYVGVRNIFVIFPEGQRPEAYITNKPLNIAGVYLQVYIG